MIALARYLSDNNLKIRKFSSIVIPIIITLFPALIVLNQPDLGTSLVMLSIIFPMLYWAGARPFYLFLLVAPVLSILSAFNVIFFLIREKLLFLFDFFEPVDLQSLAFVL